MLFLLWRYAFWFVMACWGIFVLTFLFLRSPPAVKEKKRAHASNLGLLLQSCAYVAVWFFRRVMGTPVISVAPALEMGLAVLTVLLSAGSIWMTIAAVRALGKQWSIAARVVDDHELIASGPFRLVRNPIYAGMFGLLIATGFVASHWAALLFAMGLFLVGTVIRIRAEEGLLRETFGERFDDYSRRVPALIPGI